MEINNNCFYTSHLTAQRKNEMIQHYNILSGGSEYSDLKKLYMLNSDTQLLFYASALGPDTSGKDIYHVSKLYLEQHKQKNPCFVTSVMELESALDYLHENQQTKLELVTCGHYDPTADQWWYDNNELPWSAYFYTEMKIEKASMASVTYFSGLINKYSFITKYRAIGCRTAQLKERINIHNEAHQRNTFKINKPSDALTSHCFLNKLFNLITRKDRVILKGETVAWITNHSTKFPFILGYQGYRSVQLSNLNVNMTESNSQGEADYPEYVLHLRLLNKIVKSKPTVHDIEDLILIKKFISSNTFISSVFIAIKSQHFPALDSYNDIDSITVFLSESIAICGQKQKIQLSV